MLTLERPSGLLVPRDGKEAADQFRMQSAHHEAAHLVVALELGEGVSRVCLPKDGKDGRTVLEPNYSWADYEAGDVPPDIVRDRIVSLWAGPVVTPEERALGAMADLRKLSRMSAYYAGDVRDLVSETRRVLDLPHVQHWHHVFASELFERGKLAGEDIEAILEEAS